MAKKFGASKAPKHWLKTINSVEFLSSLSEVRNLTSSELVKVRYGNNGGTWMHEDVAYDDRANELKDIDADLRYILKEINAHRNNPFTIKVGDRSYFYTYISEEGKIIAPAPTQKYHNYDSK